MRPRYEPAPRATRLGLAGLVVALAVAGCAGGSTGASPTAGATLAATPSASASLMPSPTPSPARGPGFIPTGSMTTARGEHAAILLGDGCVLIAGGMVDGGESDAAELYDPEAGTFSPTGSMVYRRIGPTATLLPNGLVLVAGGSGMGGTLKRAYSAELFDPKAGKFSLTGGMNVIRYDQAATLLPNGLVLLVGGSTTDPVAYSGDFVALALSHEGVSRAVASAELYDPKTGTFSLTGSMKTARDGPTATLLPDGRVLVAGGSVGAENNYKPVASAELYDPKTGRFSPTGSMSAARTGHTATRLTDGRVLIAGGWTTSEAGLASAAVADFMEGWPCSADATHHALQATVRIHVAA
ncbi:MAG: kelch repeat-containing protein [Candidatus Limnocylindrales bacterium]